MYLLHQVQPVQMTLFVLLDDLVQTSGQLSRLVVHILSLVLPEPRQLAVTIVRLVLTKCLSQVTDQSANLTLHRLQLLPALAELSLALVEVATHALHLFLRPLTLLVEALYYTEELLDLRLMYAVLGVPLELQLFYRRGERGVGALEGFHAMFGRF